MKDEIEVTQSQYYEAVEQLDSVNKKLQPAVRAGVINEDILSDLRGVSQLLAKAESTIEVHTAGIGEKQE